MRFKSLPEMSAVFREAATTLLRSCDALKIKPIMNLYTSVFAYVCSIGLYNGIVNADTQNVRIANADGQGSLRIGTK